MSGIPQAHIRAVMRTDAGMVRTRNEDFAYVDPAGRFFIVADGMGGHAAGDVASGMAVEVVRGTLERARPDILAADGGDWRETVAGVLEDAVRAAHRVVSVSGRRDWENRGMGTTLDVVLIAGDEAFVAHVGDGRTYLVRDGQSVQMTTDHTVAGLLVSGGKLTSEEAEESPLRTVLVNAIGMVAADIVVEIARVPLRKGDQILVCSDGLHEYFGDDELAERLSAEAPEAALDRLVGLAKDRGGHDNVTGVVVQVFDITEADVDGFVAEPYDDDAVSDGTPVAVEEIDTLPVDVWDAVVVDVRGEW